MPTTSTTTDSSTTTAAGTVVTAQQQAERKHSYVPTAGIEVYHEGSKSYWKARATVDVIIVSHTKHLCVEIIVFDPERNREANRIYVSSILLAGKVDQQELQAKITEKKEALIRQKKPVNVTQLTKDLLVASMTNYLLQRLQIKDNTTELFTIELTPMSSDCVVVEDDKLYLDIVCPVKPNTLVPLESNFSKKYKSADITSTLKSLQQEGAELKKATRIAELATSSVDGFKAMMLEKQRIEREMKKFSIARLRWIRAINRVLAMNYARKVRARVIGMGIYKPPEDEEEEEHPLFVRTPPPIARIPDQAKSIKNIRHTIDNSMMNVGKAESCPSMNTDLHGLAPSLAAKSSDAVAHIKEENAKKRRDRHHMLPHIRGRRSLNTEMFQKVISGEKTLPQVTHTEAPSLIQSYTSISQKIAPAVALTALGEMKLPPTQRPMHLVKH